MLHHLEVSNFRALEKFRMEHLGRINLLVGTNNCGKTSVLEAISILMAQGSWEALWSALARRGESYTDGDSLEVAPEHLFHGHQISPDSRLLIDGMNEGTHHHFEAWLRRHDELDPVQRLRLQLQLERASRSSEGNDEVVSPLVISMRWGQRDAPREVLLPMTGRGRVPLRYLESSRSLTTDIASIFITTEALSRDEVSLLLEEAMLTPEEETVLSALRTIEPEIERIVPVDTVRRSVPGQSRGGVAVKLAGQRLPIGSLGDGIWRILGIALALVRARGGILLVDEIDTGLHYSILGRMWHLVSETARRLDVQVFATTHSRDCYESLAAIARPAGHDVTIQRIERGNPRAIAFSEAEIIQAAKRGIEVR